MSDTVKVEVIKSGFPWDRLTALAALVVAVGSLWISYETSRVNRALAREHLEPRLSIENVTYKNRRLEIHAENDGARTAWVTGISVRVGLPRLSHAARAGP